MKLFVDVGNTALKWRFRQGEKVEQGGCRHGRDWPVVIDTLLKDGGHIESIWIASVAGPSADAEIANLLAERTGVSPCFYIHARKISGCVAVIRSLASWGWTAGWR